MSTDARDARPWLPARPRVHALAVELTAFCNQRCDYCYNAWRGDGGASLRTEATERVLARVERVLDAADVEHVTVTGGEPLASHDLFPLLDCLRARHVRAQIVSNGTLVTDALAARLARYRLLAVLVTLNGPDAATHDALVGAEGHFERTLTGIARLRRQRVPVQGAIVLTRKNAARTGETLARFAALGVRTVALSRFSPAGYSTAFARELMPTPGDVRTGLAHAAHAVRDAGLTVFATMPIPPCVVDPAEFPEVTVNHCPIGTERQEFALGPRGELRHCPLHRDALPGALDVLDPATDLAALLAPHDPTDYRATLPAHCVGCAHAARCGGGCGAAAQWAHGDRSRPDPFVPLDGAATPARARSLPVVY